MDTLVATTPFSRLIDQLKEEDGVFRTSPSEEWRQGRTLFGGLTAAIAVAASVRAFAPLPPLRSAQFTFVGPASADLEVTPRLIRAGKSATFVDVTVQSEGQPALKATLTFGAARRSSHCYRALPRPDVLPPDSFPPFFDAPFSPRFSRQFDARLAEGARPVTGAAKPDFTLWIRHRDPGAPDNAASIIALGDVPPPAAMSMFTTPAPISTVTWSIDVLTDQFTGADWHLIEVDAETVGEGYSSQRMTLWHACGAPVLAARQTVAVFG